MMQRRLQRNCVLLFLAFCIIGQVKPQPDETSNIQQADAKISVDLPKQQSVKKELKDNSAQEPIMLSTPSPPAGTVANTGKQVIIDEKKVIESLGKAIEKQLERKDSENIKILESTTKSSALEPQLHQHHFNENFTSIDVDDISDSLKAGLYLFLILSAGAIIFIIFKIYTLRLSRAERRYGVQGDRCSQELTPLPISIEDTHSDDEDQTLFERIL